MGSAGVPVRSAVRFSEGRYVGMVEGIFVEGLVYGIMVLGLFITFRILDFPDLTVDGSFPLGAAILTSLIVHGFPIVPALLLAFAGGTLAGGVTAVIHTRLKVPNLLAGILTMTMLYSVNIRILGNSTNVPLLGRETLLTRVVRLFDPLLAPEYAELAFFIVLVTAIVALLTLFFKTDLGLTMGALGGNPQMVISQGMNPEAIKIIGVGIANGFVALSGAFAAQYLGFADVGLGQGIVVSGLASIMIGELLIRSNRIGVLLIRAALGSILFKAVMYAGRMYGYTIGMTPNDLKLITGLLTILLIVLARFDLGKLSYNRKRRRRDRVTGTAGGGTAGTGASI